MGTNQKKKERDKWLLLFLSIRHFCFDLVENSRETFTEYFYYEIIHVILIIFRMFSGY